MTNRAVRIRRATQADAGAIAEVHLRSHRETYVPLVGEAEYWPADLAQRLQQWREALAGEGMAFLASEGGQAVGFAHALGSRITTLYILASHHRRGIGRALLTRLLAALAERGIATASFAVLAVNKKAIRFYEALGARATGTAVVDEHGARYEDRLFEIATRG